MADSASGNPFYVPREVCRDFTRSSRLEWLDTNHTGAFAMGTVAGVNTRRYHSLLVGSKHPPADRAATLARIEETVTVFGRQFELATGQYPGTVHPRGFEMLDEFRLDPLPAWRYDLNGVALKKTVCLIDKRQSALVCYHASHACSLQARLLLSCRDYHSLARQNPALSTEAEFGDGRCRFSPYENFPALTILHSGQAFHPDSGWNLQNECLRELERGLDFAEDLYSPGYIVFELQPDRRVWLLASIEDGEYKRSLQDDEVEALLTAETKRRVFKEPAARALDQFRIVRERERPSLIAGYPWFTDWSRDTLIGLPALSAAGWPFAETKAILGTLLEQRSQGLLPNRFTDRRDELEYNTVDATLWFFIAAHDYVAQSGDTEFLASTLYPAAVEILAWHNRGTAFNIKNDPFDNLLSAGIEGVQLTWMDAKVGDRVITPRIGKPVEINALWHNALRIAAGWAESLGETSDAAAFSAQAQATRDSFNKQFWNERTGCLYDVLAKQGNDASVRPNQLFAIALPHPLLNRDRAESVMNVVRDKLLTPMGLRTLSPDDPAYCGRFEGGMAARDGAYHQGTVWPWLLGPYVRAHLYAFGHNAFSIAYCDGVLRGIENQMGACCLGSVCEVYDGDEPQRPAGCPAQLWSVAQLLVARRLVDEAR